MSKVANKRGAKKTESSEPLTTKGKARPKDSQADIKTGGKGLPGRSTPPKVSMNKESGKEAQIGSLEQTVGSALQFLKEVNIEGQKISWPGRDQVIRETYSVLVLVAAITGLVLGFDWLVGHFVFIPLEHWAHLHSIGVGKG